MESDEGEKSSIRLGSLFHPVGHLSATGVNEFGGFGKEKNLTLIS